MDDLTPLLLAAIWVIIAVTHVLGALAAFGSSLLAVPALVLVLGNEQLGDIVRLMVILGLVQAAAMAFRLYRQVDWKKLCPVLLASAACLPLGMYLVTYLPRQPLLLLLAGVIAWSAWKARQPTTDKPLHPAITAGLSGVGGIIHGAFGTGGAVLVALMQRVEPQRDTFRANLSIIWLILNGAMLGLFAIRQGSLGLTEDSNPMVVVSSILTVAVVTVLSESLARRVSQKAFATLVVVLLWITAGALVFDAIARA